jgi:hypothetical protein
LLILTGNFICNNGNINSEGCDGGYYGGGASGGGNINIFYNNYQNNGNISSKGGTGGFPSERQGGDGGNGSIITTPIQLFTYKYLLNDNGDIKTYNNGWSTLGTSISEIMFKNNGMNNIAVRENVSISESMTSNNVLDNGMEFNHNINFDTLENITTLTLN